MKLTPVCFENLHVKVCKKQYCEGSFYTLSEQLNIFAQVSVPQTQKGCHKT